MVELHVVVLAVAVFSFSIGVFSGMSKSQKGGK
jgi:hypothetical protein